LGQEAHFAGHIRHERRRHHLPEDDRVHLGGGQVGALQQLTRDEAGELHGPDILERGARAAEWRPTSRHDRDTPPVSSWHYILLRAHGSTPTTVPARGPSGRNADDRNRVLTPH